MQNILNFIDGKKTYITGVILFVLGGLTAVGVEIPTYVYEMLAAFGIVAAKSALTKLEK